MGYVSNYYRKYGGRSEYFYEKRAIVFQHLIVSFLLASLIIGIALELEDINKFAHLYIIGTLGEVLIFIFLFLGRMTRKPIGERSAVVMLYSFVICSSLAITLLLYIVLKTNPLGVVSAVFITTIILILAILSSKETLEHLNTIFSLIMGLFGLGLVVWLIAIATQDFYSIFYLISGGISAAILSLYLFIDFARIESNSYDSPAIMALWIFYDIIFLFKQLLANSLLGRDD